MTTITISKHLYSSIDLQRLMESAGNRADWKFPLKIANINGFLPAPILSIEQCTRSLHLSLFLLSRAA